MAEPQFPRSVVSVKVLTPSAPGAASAATPVFVRGGKKKRGTKEARPFEKMVRKLVEGQLATAQAYLDRHNRSNSRKRDGWLKDMGDNVFKAVKAGRRHMKDEGEDDDL